MLHHLLVSIVICLPMCHPWVCLITHFPDGPVASHLLSLMYKNCALPSVCQMFHVPTNLSFCNRVLPLCFLHFHFQNLSVLSFANTSCTVHAMCFIPLFQQTHPSPVFLAGLHLGPNSLLCDTQLGLKQLCVSHVYF